jgi:hypothetical protein
MRNVRILIGVNENYIQFQFFLLFMVTDRRVMPVKYSRNR